ncbi:sensor histidine kinase [Marinomonas sp. A79]|uniref:Sensor histidine kinase n=1 Tax=Marinomonas vulgaris TaxID=2823372 RepID=A0ABS5HBG9_9GAMM|nr:sensor histidine kinase [Marinomonas vulgaris]MBR7889006.1 sensor histidine kinase [Marinomonas vulgaris]
MFHRFILLFLLIASNTAWSANVISIIDDVHDATNIGNNGAYFIDPSASLSLEDVQSDQYSKQFRPLNREYLQFGFVQGNIWIRNDIAIRTTNSTPILLEINSPRLQYLDIYLPNLYDTQVQAELGGARPYTNRPVKTSNYVFPIPPNTPPVFTLYIKLSSYLPINAQIELKTLSKLSQDTQYNLTLTGLLIGILLTLFVFNVFFFIRTSHPMYLMYGILLIGIVILHLSIHDQMSQIFPDYTNVQERIYNLAALSCLCAIVFFSRLYLDNRTYLPKMDKVLLAIGFINALFAVLFLVSPEKIHIIALSCMMISTLIILTIHAIIAFINNVPFSQYYLTARLTLCVGYFTWILSVYGIVPSMVIFQWGLTVTIIIEAMIHFTGMIAQTSPLLQRQTQRTPQTEAKVTDLLSDVSSRLRRQTHLIGSALSCLEQTVESNDNKTSINNSQVANNNIQNLIERLDMFSRLNESLTIEQPTPQPLNQLIDNAYSNTQRLDQDSAVIEIITHKADQVEILENAPLLQHLIENLAQECKHFTDQTLTINIMRHEINREGIMLLELNCYPLPSRTRTTTDSLDLGMHYITMLIQHLKGQIQFSENNLMRSANIQIPIRAHIRPINTDTAHQHHFDIVLFGQADSDLQKTLSLLQSHTNKIEHFTTLDSLLEHLELPALRTTGTIILVFDNGGHIPHITQQRLLPLMREEDQCLLISNNVKMSLNYAKKLGFDELLTSVELDNQLEPQLSRLMQRGDRLKSNTLSRINP